MRIQWLHRQSCNKLLVFFSGWGIDAGSFSQLVSTEYDVLFVDRYVDLDFTGIPALFAQYDYTVMIGWSMGVWVISRFLRDRSIKADFVSAVNGTEAPVHELFGIAPQWFNATIEQFDQQVLEKFYRRMCLDKNIFKKFLANRPARSLVSLKEELVFLYSESKTYSSHHEASVFDSALISTRDMIFPAANQNKFWSKAGVKIIEHKTPHFCFQKAQCWEDVIALVKNERADH